MSEFDLSKYNKEQKEAILDFSNNLLILACAGSGKTSTITAKMAYAISNNIVRPEEICAVTFTNKAASEMKERLIALAPDAENKATVRTFHSLGVVLLRKFGSMIGLPHDFSIANDSDVTRIIKKALGLTGTDAKTNAKITAEWILNAKEHGYDSNNPKAKEFFNLDNVHYGNAADQLSWQGIFNAYEEEKKEQKLLDFPDLIIYAVKLVENCPKAREYYQKKFRMVLVDEYQDSNTMQARFLKSFVSKDAQLIVVGDDDQSIYAFRGAIVENILRFPQEFDNVREICLEKNYRSTSEILSVAGTVIAHNSKRYVKDILSATNYRGLKPQSFEFSAPYTEARNIIDTLSQLPENESKAILYRQHRCAIVLKKMLLENNIPFRVFGGTNVLDSKGVKNAVALLKVIVSPEDFTALHRIITESRIKLGEVAYREISSVGDSVMKSIATVRDGSKKGTVKRNSLHILYTVLSMLSRQFMGCDIAESTTSLPSDSLALFDPVSEPYPLKYSVEEYNKATDSELLEMCMEELSMTGMEEEESDDGSGKDNPLELYLHMVDNRMKWFDGEMVADYEGGVPTELQVMQSFICRSELGDDVGEKEGPSVLILSTMHAAKGLEWDNVFVIGLADEVIPGKTVNKTESDIEEERRVFYVAITRARKRLWLCRCFSGPSYMGPSVSLTKSRFLCEIPDHLIVCIDSKEQKPSFKSRSFSTPTPKKVQVAIKNRVCIGDKVMLQDSKSGRVMAVSEQKGKRVVRVKTETGSIVNCYEDKIIAVTHCAY